MALTTVLMAMAADPKYLATCPVPPTIILEKSTTHGGKYWKGYALPTGVRICFGRNGTAGQQRDVARDQCRDANPERELLHRSLDKISKGYHLDM